MWYGGENTAGGIVTFRHESTKNYIKNTKSYIWRFTGSIYAIFKQIQVFGTGEKEVQNGIN